MFFGYLLGTCMGTILMQRKILPLHGSAIEIEGKVYAIVGDSGERSVNPPRGGHNGDRRHRERTDTAAGSVPVSRDGTDATASQRASSTLAGTSHASSSRLPPEARPAPLCPETSGSRFDGRNSSPDRCIMLIATLAALALAAPARFCCWLESSLRCLHKGTCRAAAAHGSRSGPAVHIRQRRTA